MLAYHGFVAVLALSLVMAAPRPVPMQAIVPMKVTITIAGATQTLRGTGRCGHEPNAWIYGNSAALWMAEYEGENRGTRLSLSYWRLAARGIEPQFTLSVTGKAADHRINTVKGGKPEGSGRATFRPTATGGRFEISGKAQDGAALQATIECARFGGIHAEGG